MADFAGPFNNVIADEGTLSAALDVPRGSVSCLVEVPTIDSAAITLQASFDGTTFRDLYNIDNTQQGRTTASTGSFFQPFLLFGWVKQIKVKSGATQSTAAVTLKVTFSR